MASTSLSVIRTLTIRAKTEGVDQAASSLGKLAGEQEKVAKSSTQLERATLSQEKAFQRFEKSIDPAARAQSKLAEAARQLQRAQDAGLITQARSSELMQLAIRAHNSSGDAAKKHSQALQELSSVGQGLSGNLGSVGGIIARLGPAGLAIAATIGGLALGFGIAAKGALELADAMGKLVDMSDTLGLSVEQLRALQVVAGEVGVSAEQLETNLGKFTATLGSVRDGSQGAIDAFEKLGAGFSDQVRGATSTEEALNLVLGRLREVDTATAALASKEIFGKGGLGMTRIAGATTTLAELAKQMNALDVVTTQQAKTWDQLGDAINKNMSLAGTNVKATFATPVLEALEQISKIVLELSRTFKLLGTDSITLDTTPLENFRVELQLLNVEITQFGAMKAIDNLAERLGIGSGFTSTVSSVIDIIKLLAAAFQDLITIMTTAGRLLANFATGGFSGAAAAAAATADAYRNLGTTLLTLGDRARTAATGTQELTEVAVEGQKAASGQTREWIVFGNQMEKVGGIVPPVSTAVGGLGKAHALAGKETKGHKEEVEKLSPAMQELSQVAGQLGSALVSAFLKGESAAKALKTTLQGVASSATSGAITKLIQGDFAGAAVSGGIAIASAVGSFLFGDDEDEKAQAEAAKQAAEAARAAAEALQQARDAFAGLSREIQEFTNTANGTQIGALTQALADFSDQSVKLQEAAIAAQNDTALAAIRQTAAAGMNRFLRQFLNDVDDLISEFGTEGIMQEARQSVRDLMLQYSSLQDSIDEFARRTGADTEILRQNLQGSAFKALVEMLGDVPEISETANEIQRLKGVASELDDALVQLGVAAEDAAIIVEQRLAASLARLAGDFLDPIIREINAFVGGGWINQATDLLARVRQLTADATALGLDTTLIQTLFVLSAQDIINQNQLVGASFEALVRMLGLADAGLHQFTNTVEDAAAVIVRSAQEIANAIQSNEDRLFLAIHRSDTLADQLARFDLAAQREREREIAAGGQALASLERALAQERLNIINDYNAQQLAAQQAAAQQAAEEAARVRREQIEAAQRAAEERARVLKEATDFIQGQVRRINDWINNFLSGEQSILKPSQQMATARTHFASELSLAASGNRDALSNITTSAQQVVDSVRRYYGSSAAGQAIIQQLLTSLRTLPGQLSPEEFIVQGLTTPINNIPPAVVPPIVGGIIDQTTVLQALLNNLKTAIQTGDAQATAIALLPLFDKLDTTMDGALSYQELVQGLGTTFSTGTLQKIFTELDGNGNGLLEKSELIKAAAQGTQGNTNTANSLLQLTTQRIAEGTAETVLWLKNIWDKINILIQQIIDGVRAPLMTIAAWAPGSSHAMGGWITGGVPGRDSVSARLMPGEFVVKESIARNNPWLEGFNQTGMYPAANDNANVVAAIGRLERSLLRGFKALIETEFEAAGVIAKPIQEANKITRTRRGEKKKVA